MAGLSVLILVAHSDDEAIGMGGTISKHVEAGDSVFALSMTDGIGSRIDLDQRSDPALARRLASAEKSFNIVYNTASLPYGRGGSPITNLIINGCESSPVCAIAMTKELEDE